MCTSKEIAHSYSNLRCCQTTIGAVHCLKRTCSNSYLLYTSIDGCVGYNIMEYSLIRFDELKRNKDKGHVSVDGEVRSV